MSVEVVCGGASDDGLVSREVDGTREGYVARWVDWFALWCVCEMRGTRGLKGACL